MTLPRNRQRNFAVRRLRAFGGAIELPIALGAVFWYRSYQGVTGDPVSQWNDLSGNNNHLTVPPAPSTATAPTVEDAILDGKPSVRFDGVANRLWTPPLTYVVNKRFTLIVLSQRTGPGATGGYLFAAFGNTTGRASLTQSSTIYAFYDGVFDRTLETHTEASPELKVIRRTADTNLNFRRGRANISNTGHLDWTEDPDLPQNMGAAGNDTFPWGGDVFEVQGYDSSLSDANVILLENDIYERWGL